MEIYAAQMLSLDREIGRVVALLKRSDRLDNTLIAFCSDNGASNERQSAGKAWAQVSNVPYPKVKKYIDGGGIRTPMILHWPDATPSARCVGPLTAAMAI